MSCSPGRARDGNVIFEPRVFRSGVPEEDSFDRESTDSNPIERPPAIGFSATDDVNSSSGDQSSLPNAERICDSVLIGPSNNDMSSTGLRAGGEVGLSRSPAGFTG